VPKRLAKQPIAAENSKLEPIQALLQESLVGQEQIRKQMFELAGQNAFLAQQMAQILGLIGQQLGALRESEADLRSELKKFQTGGPQHAMASVFHKLFRDLISHINQLDALAEMSPKAARTAEEQSWIEAIQVLRGGFESLLIGWGCQPMSIAEGVDQFDPEQHEAVSPFEGEIPLDLPANLVVSVRQRGWKLHNTILQYPQVVIS
jgi:molecular chaperone GrpE (heat shock protein)